LTLQQQAKEKRIVSLGRSYFESEGPVPAINIVNEVLKRGLPTGPEAERLVLWSLRQLREKTALMGHLLPLVGVDFSPGGQVIVTADANNLFFWESDGSKLSSIDLSKLNSIDLRPFGPISGVQWSPRGDQIAVASRDQTRLLSPCSINELKKILSGDCVGKGETESFIIGDGKNNAGKAKFSQDEQWLVTGSPGEYPKRWNLDHKIGEGSAPDLEYPAKMASPSANGFAISEGYKSVDKSVIAVGDTSGKIQVFDFASGARRLTLEIPNGEVNGNVLCLAFNPRDPAMLAAAFQDGNLLVWDNWHDDSQHPIKLRGTNGIAYQIGFTNDGELLMATSDDGTPLVWETASLGDPHPWELRGHFGPVYTAAFSSDGNSLVTGSTDKTAIVWNKRPVLDKGSPDPQEASSPNGAATNAASGCGTEIILTKEFTKVGCVETPLNHVFILSPQGKVMEFDKRDTLTPVDQYQGTKDADGLKLEPDYLVITSKSGDTHWQYFDDFNKLMGQALKTLPQIKGKPLPLKREILCQIDETC
jgi:WD40 repeat protein